MRLLVDERGIALPMAMIMLVLLASLSVAFSVLARSEPVIANNHLRVTQARALADSGLERAVWALEHGGLAVPPPGVIGPTPYDGATFLGLSELGGTMIRVTGVSANEVTVDSVGWHPTNDPADPRTKAHRRIVANLSRINNIWDDAPCTLCVRGNLQVTGASTIDGRPSLATGNSDCGPKIGTTSYGVTGGGFTTIEGAGNVYGSFPADETPNQEGQDYVQYQDPSAFDDYAFSDADLNALKALAKKNGTYFQGSHTFNSSNKLPDGIVFIDTTTGQNITGDTPTAEFGHASIHGNFWAEGDRFRGWIIVNGSITISGNTKIDGLVYAMNDLSYTGTGTGDIGGQVVTRNIRDTSSTTIDTNTGGNATIKFDCNAVRNAPGLVTAWTMTAGTYRELSD